MPNLIPPTPTPTLPGATTLDPHLLDAAVAEINRLHNAKGLELARAIGTYVVQALFNNNLDTFAATSREHLTFRALAQRDDLRVSYTSVWYSVAVLDQLRVLPDDIGAALPLTHHKLLVPVRDPQTKVRLAARAVEEQLTSREFAAEVKRARAQENPGARGGRRRRPLPAFVKGMTRLRRAIELATSEVVSHETFDSYSPGKARLLMEELEGQTAALEALKERVLRGAAAAEEE